MTEEEIACHGKRQFPTRRAAKKRANRIQRGDTPTGATTCAKGHPLTRLRNQRRCLTCRQAYVEGRREHIRQYARAYRARKKEQAA